MSVMAVMPVYMRDSEDLRVTNNTIASFLATAPGVKLLLVDDHSPYVDGYEYLRSLAGPFCIHRQKVNGGFAKAVNVGLRRAMAGGNDALLVNADMEFFDPGWLDRMVAAPGDVVGGLLLYPNGLIQHAGIYYSVITRWFDHIYRFAPGNLEAALHRRVCPVTGALQLIRHNTLNKVGLYDENFKLGYEDVDYCHMVFQAGLQCVYEPSVRAIHYESMFRGNRKDKKIGEWEIESFKYLHEKHAGHSFADYIPTLLIDDDFARV